MKQMRTMKWIVLSLFLLTGIQQATAVNFGTWYNHRMSGSRNSWSYSWNGQRYGNYSIDVAPNTERLTVELGREGHGGAGNVNMYMGYGFVPSRGTYTKRSIGISYQERIVVENPRAGRYHLRFWGVSSWRACLKFTLTSKPTSAGFSRTELLNRVNYYRRQYNRVPLTLNSKLNMAAQNHAFDIASRHVLTHDGAYDYNRTVQKRVYSAGYRYSSWWDVLELIAGGYTTNARTMQAWWAEARGAILDSDIRHAGFGNRTSSDRHGHRWVAVFAKPQ